VIILSVDRQAEIFLFSVLMGLGAGMLYDAIKIFRLIIPHKKVFSEAEDGFYWIGCALFVASFMLENNSGEIRFFSVAAFFMAMGLYSVTLSPLIMRISESIVCLLKKLFLLFLEIILTPLRLVFFVVKKPAKFAKNKVKKRVYTVLILIKKYVKIKVVTYGGRLHLNRK